MIVLGLHRRTICITQFGISFLCALRQSQCQCHHRSPKHLREFAFRMNAARQDPDSLLLPHTYHGCSTGVISHGGVFGDKSVSRYSTELPVAYTIAPLPVSV